MVTLSGLEDALHQTDATPPWRQLLMKRDRVVEASRHLPKVWVMRGPRQFLDLGCGLGYAAMLWSDFYARFKIPAQVFATDLSPYYLTLARECELLSTRPGSIKYVASDGVHLPFQDKSFDAIWSAQVLYRFTSVRRGIEEIKRVLKPGGVWVGLENAVPPTAQHRAEYLLRYIAKERIASPRSLRAWSAVAKSHGLTLSMVPGSKLQAQWIRRVLACYQPVHILLQWERP